MNARISALCLLLVALPAFAKATISYKPPKDEEAEERPQATEITVAPQGSDIAFKLEFNRVPWGDECKNRCANVTIYLDTDNNPKTGLQLGSNSQETGADLAVNFQGVRDYQDQRAQSYLRIKVRALSTDTTAVDQGEVLSEMDNRRDSERVQSDGSTVYALVDATSATLPSGKTMRVVFHPPGQKPLKGTAPGMLAGGGGKVEVFKKGQKSGNKK